MIHLRPFNITFRTIWMLRGYLENVLSQKSCPFEPFLPNWFFKITQLCIDSVFDCFDLNGIKEGLTLEDFNMESFGLIQNWLATLALILLGEFPTCLGEYFFHISPTTSRKRLILDTRWTNNGPLVWGIWGDIVFFKRIT